MMISSLILFITFSTAFLNALPLESFTLADNVHINIQNGSIGFTYHNRENKASMKGNLGVLLDEQGHSPQLIEKDGEKWLNFKPDLNLTVQNIDEHCIHIRWLTKRNITLEDCFDFAEDSWYGGPQNRRQYWPFNNMTFNDNSYITKQEHDQALAEPYWVTSSGFYIYVNLTTPLFIDSNNHYNNSFCLISRQAEPYLPRGETSLDYKICAYENVKEAHMAAIHQDLGHPSDIPDERMVYHPIWSTWVRFKWDVNDTSVMAFAKEIVDNKFNNSQIEIDDNWETCYGSVKFNRSRFPHMSQLSSDLHAMGFRVTLWNHPFINTNCHLFNQVKEKGYLVEDQNGNVVTKWWDGECGAVDFTNPKAAQWFLDRHFHMMKENQIDGLKLDAGESSWLPKIPRLHTNITDQPNSYTSAYVKTMYKFGKMTEVRVGHHTQNIPLFVRMIDRDSKWNFENGLATLITAAFQITLNGYPYVLPDMVGGNAYAGDVVTKELFIRWLQANTFMPVVQFSAAPWDFDTETIEISRKFTSLHYQYSDLIIQLMKDCVKTGKPLNMPLWWVAPTDQVAHTMWSEYMLGEDLLVAPVVEMGAVTRDIYLPEGRWQDQVDLARTEYVGPQWLHDYPAPLDTLPYFIRVTNKTDTITVTLS